MRNFVLAFCVLALVVCLVPVHSNAGAKSNATVLAGTTSPVPPEPPVTLAGTTSPVPPEPPYSFIEGNGENKCGPHPRCWPGTTSPVPPEPHAAI